MASPTILAAFSAAVLTSLPDGAFAAPVILDQALPGDTAWLLAASALSLLALPGLAYYYGGVSWRRKPTSVPVQIGLIAAVVSLLWVMLGYTLAFAETTGGWLGGGSRWMLLQIEAVRFGTTVPESAFALHHMILAVTAAAFMIGAWTDRARVGWVALFAGFWSLLVYAPVAHWLWGGGWLAQQIGTVDYSGGLVIHGTAGVSALVVALLMGRRTDFSGNSGNSLPGHHSTIGIWFLWIALFGVTGAGLMLGATDETAAAIINLHMSASASALIWLGLDRIGGSRPSGQGFAIGALVGLVAISSGAGFVSAGAAIVIGAVAAAICRTTSRFVRSSLRIEDTFGVFAINGVGGIVGALLAGVFMSADWGGTGYAEEQTMAGQLMAQFIGTGAIAIWSIFVTGLLATAISLFIPMRVREEKEPAAVGTLTRS